MAQIVKMQILDLCVSASRNESSFNPAAVTISGIELAHKIKKEQFDISTVEQRVQKLCEAVLAL